MPTSSDCLNPEHDLSGLVPASQAASSLAVRCSRSATLLGYTVLLVAALATGTTWAKTPVADTLTIFETSGEAQINRPVSIARPFRAGEIRTFARASVDGTPVLTQNDVKNRWPDGSLKFAVISFVVPSLPANGAVKIVLDEQTTPVTDGALTQAAMLAPEYDFDAQIELRGATTRLVSARGMLDRGHWRYWLRGPIVTAVILEDRTPARVWDQDFGDGSRALHPIFEAWFYPQGHRVEVGFTVENTWVSSNAAVGMRDLEYGLALRSGHAAPRLEFTHPPFRHIGKSRWHKRLWLGVRPGSVRIDHNISYLVTTGAIPNYDTGLSISESLIAEKYGDWIRASKRIDGDRRGIGNYEKDLTTAGAHDWIGLLPTWDTLYLLTMDDRLRQMATGNADLAGRIPWHFRELDRAAGTGHYFDAPESGQVDTQGRVVSVNARRTVSLWDLGDSGSDCGRRWSADRIRTGRVSSEGWETTRDHMPDTAYLAYLLNGRYYYLEELQYLAAFIVGHKTACYADNAEESWRRQGHYGYLSDSQVRGDAWGFRTLAYAAFLSPDTTPEKAYFEDKLRNNIAAWEGDHDLPLSDPARRKQWQWAHSYRRDARGPSPLGIWKDQGPEPVQPPLYTDGRLATAGGGWEENFLVTALGMARQFGYPTDNLLRFMARLRFNLLLNPAADPYLIEVYRWPNKLTATKDWVKRYPAFTAQYPHPPKTWQEEGTADHGYGFIALAAMSFLTSYTVDGYDGRAAWNLYHSRKPGQDRFATESPKWAILPFGDAGRPVVSGTPASPDTQATKHAR